MPNGVLRVTRRMGRDERGASIVELALLFPLLMILMLWATDATRLFIADVGLANSAREAARYGAIFPSDTAGIKQRVYDELGSASIGSDPSQVTSISIARTSAPTPPGGAVVEVTVSYRFTFLSPMPLSSPTLTLTNTATMLILGVQPNA